MELTPIPFALDVTNNLVSYNPSKGHLVIGGSTGSGKSGVINSIVEGLSPDPSIQIMGFDLKLVELPIWKDRMCFLATNSAQVELGLTWANEIMDTRYRYMNEIGVRDWDYSWGPQLQIIADELAEIFSLDQTQGDEKNQRARRALRTGYAERIARLGRAAGIGLISCTQRPSQAVLPEQYRDQHIFRMCLGVRESETGKMVLGSRIPGFDPRLIGFDTPGKGYLLGKEVMPKVIRAFRVDENRAKATAETYSHLTLPLPSRIQELHQKLDGLNRKYDYDDFDKG